MEQPTYMWRGWRIRGQLRRNAHRPRLIWRNDNDMDARLHIYGSGMLLKSMTILGYLATVTAHATPTMSLPEVSKGTVAHKSFAGTLCDTPTDILTVPEGQEFLVTMVSMSTEVLPGC